MDEQTTFSPIQASSSGARPLPSIDADVSTAPLAEPWPEQLEQRARVGVARWTTASAGAAPLLLIGGFIVAAAIQPSSYDPIRDTISALAAPGATDRWVMTAFIAAVGACYVTTAIGLRAARLPGRVTLAGGGLATAWIAVSPTPLHGYSREHAFAVVAAAAAMSAWPVLAAHRRHRARVMTHLPNVMATFVTLSLVIWFALEAGGGDLGLAERCAAVAPALWLFPVAFGTRRSLALEVQQPSAAPAPAPTNPTAGACR